MHASIGIDFGTDYCRVARLVGSQPQLIANARGELETPCWISAGEGGRAIVGRPARPNVYAASSMPLTAIKSLLASRDGVWFGGALRTPVEITSLLLQALRADVEHAGGEPINAAVIGVPAMAGTLQRSSIRQAADLAGLTTVRLVNEPIAAAMVHAGAARRRMLVYSLGAGSFEVVVIEADNTTFTTLSAEGHEGIAGSAFSQLLVAHALDKIKRRYASDLSADPRALWLIGEAVEAAKIKLSGEERAPISIRDAGRGASGDRFDIEVELTRADLESICRAPIAHTIELAHQALDGAKLTIADIDDLLLVGRSTRLPLVRQLLSEAFSKSPVLASDALIALGTALHTASLASLSPQSAGRPDTPPLAPAQRALDLARTPQLDPAARDALAPQLIRQAGDARRTGDAGQVAESRDQEQSDATIEHLEQIYQSDRSNLHNREALARAYYLEAARLVKANHLGTAIRALERAFQFNPHERIRQDLIQACRHEGSRLIGERCWPKAIDIFRIGLGIDPSNEEFKQYLVAACLSEGHRLMSISNLPEAIDMFRIGIEFDPRNQDIRNSLGTAEARLKQEQSGNVRVQRGRQRQQ